MDTNFVSSAGVSNPILIYGTAWKKEKTADLVALALAKGFRGIDTACQPKHYKEALVGEGLKRAYATGLKRKDIFLQTKFTPRSGQDPNDIPYDPHLPLPEQISNSFAVSKKNLHTDYIDSLVLHSPLETWEDTWSAWQAMEQIHATGQVKQLGISNCYGAALLKKLYDHANIKPAVLQNRFYPDTDYDRELRPFCREKNIAYQSFWTLRANPHLTASKPVLDLAMRLNKTSAQIFFRCLIQQHIFPLIGTTSAQHMVEDLDILNFSLSEQECAEIMQEVNS